MLQPTVQELVDLRRLGQTNIGTLDKEGNYVSGPETFAYVHLRAPLPSIEKTELWPTAAPESYFLMRRNSDGYVSASGMFVELIGCALRSIGSNG